MRTSLLSSFRESDFTGFWYDTKLAQASHYWYRGSYGTRSLREVWQRCKDLYVERNPSRITNSDLVSITDKSSFRALYFSQVAENHKEPTVYKLIVVGEEERIVGVHIIGLGSDEALQGFAVAIKMGGTSRNPEHCPRLHAGNSTQARLG